MLDCQSYSIFSITAGNSMSTLLDSLGRMSHSDSPADGREHLQVVRVITNGHDMLQRYAQAACKCSDAVCLTTTWGHHRQLCTVKIAELDGIPGDRKGRDSRN